MEIKINMLGTYLKKMNLFIYWLFDFFGEGVIIDNKNTLFYFPICVLFHKKKIKRPVSKSTTFFIENCWLRTGSFFLFENLRIQCLDNDIVSQSIFWSFLLLLTCFGTLFLRTKTVDEFVDDQLEDGVTFFVFSIFVYLPVDVQFFFSGFAAFTFSSYTKAFFWIQFQ